MATPCYDNRPGAPGILIKETGLAMRVRLEEANFMDVSTGNEMLELPQCLSQLTCLLELFGSFNMSKQLFLQVLICCCNANSSNAASWPIHTYTALSLDKGQQLLDQCCTTDSIWHPEFSCDVHHSKWQVHRLYPAFAVIWRHMLLGKQTCQPTQGQMRPAFYKRLHGP